MKDRGEPRARKYTAPALRCSGLIAELQRAGNRMSSAYHVAVGAALAVACIATWWLPGSKEAAVFGRLDYLQFVVAVSTTLLVLLVAVVGAGPAASRQLRTFRVFAACGGALLVLAVAEAVALLWPAQHLMDNPWYVSTQRAIEADRKLRFSRPPGIAWTGQSRGDLAMLAGIPDSDARLVTFGTDYQGFRNESDLRSADVVFIGDSFTEAGNVPERETFVRRLADARDVVARNLGVAGYTAQPELVVLERFGLAVGPRTIVWQLAESNDLEEAVVFEAWKQAGRPDFRVEPAGLPSPGEVWSRRSPTHRLFDRLRVSPSWPLAGAFLDAAGREREVMFLPLLPGAEHSPVGHAGWPPIEAALRSGAAILEERGIELVVLLIPMKLRVLADSVSFGSVERTGARRAAPPARGLKEWDLAPQATLSHAVGQLCAELGIGFVDPTERLRAEAAMGQLVYLPLDTHLSSAGHAVVAAALAETLRLAPARP